MIIILKKLKWFKNKNIYIESTIFKKHYTFKNISKIYHFLKNIFISIMTPPMYHNAIAIYPKLRPTFKRHLDLPMLFPKVLLKSLGIHLNGVILF